MQLPDIWSQQRFAQSLHMDSQASLRMVLPSRLESCTEAKARSPCQGELVPQGSSTTDELIGESVVATLAVVVIILVVAVTVVPTPFGQALHSCGNSAATRVRAAESLKEPPSGDISQAILSPQEWPCAMFSSQPNGARAAACAAVMTAACIQEWSLASTRLSMREKYLHLPRPSGNSGGVSHSKPTHVPAISFQHLSAQSLQSRTSPSTRVGVPSSFMLSP